MKIICAVDLTSSTTWLIEAAATLAKQCGAELMLVHVMPEKGREIDFHPTIEARFRPRRKYYREPDSPEKGDSVPILHDRAFNLLQTVSDWLKEQGVSADISIIHGNEVEGILSQAEKYRADMIMLAGHRHNPVYQMLMGSVCEEVIKHSPVPVTIVPPTAT
ncbi:universal stress protein [Prosthecochloris sp. HL-130-GSB]|uniref:universal stress protein n=1 Tax=Prosthecochloris sp. HL-130-GSB TaxID=1974213 RepID=UPI000A1C179F|nr:universal stress protein [Prosthecochloris sp. HL-130-GSB]ARM31651.1 universal stress protein UspA [Prosthecochloris sp. HL-130-GSB]